MKRIAFVVVLWLGAAGCSRLPGQPSASPASPSGLRSLPLADDFSDPASGWPSRESKGWSQDYEDGVFRVTLDQDLWSYVLAAATARIDASDVIVETDLRFASNYSEAGAGVICRALDGDNYYFFEIEEGTASIVRFLEDEQTFLVDDQPTDTFDPEGSRLRAECIGDNLTFFIDGQQVASAQDDGLTHGDVGLIAGGAGQGFTDVRFDNFSAQSP